MGMSSKVDHGFLISAVLEESWILHALYYHQNKKDTISHVCLESFACCRPLVIILKALSQFTASSNELAFFILNEHIVTMSTRKKIKEKRVRVHVHVLDFYYLKVSIMTKCLLQNATDIITKCVRFFITKCDSFITKCNRYYKLRRFYYKMWQLLRNATFITNCDSTL